MPDGHSPESITFAIVSDLHCRLENDADDSFLKVGALRSPSSRHPVQSLLELISREGIEGDALLVPGDLANRARVEGLVQGWEHSLEIGRALRAKAVIPVIGNHDVDSYHAYPQHDELYNVRNLRPGFPFAREEDAQQFFSDGFCVLTVGPAEIIAMNSVIDHHDKETAKRGAFDEARIEKMEEILRGKLVKPLRIGLLHHHPILHSPDFMGVADVIPTGDSLLAALRRVGCRLIIHGHKHHARLSFINGMAVFASGSFSAMLREFGTSTSNTFHVVTVEARADGSVRGKIYTWVFRYGLGWRRANAEHRGFPFLAGFGRTMPLHQITTALLSLADSAAEKTRFLETEIMELIPDAEFLTPNEREEINQILEERDLKLAEFDNGRLELWRSFRP